MQHAAYPDLDDSTSFFGVYDGHGGKDWNVQGFLSMQIMDGHFHLCLC